MKVSEYLVRFLKRKGVRDVFGLPGGENVPILEEMRRQDLHFRLVHHEAAAGFAADVTGQLTGRPGVCMATGGPGAVNLLSTAISATLERSPVLAITAEIDEAVRERVTHMRTDLHRLFATGTKGSFWLTPETAAVDLETAWSLAMAFPRGAVHLAISSQTASAEIGPRGPMPAPFPASNRVAADTPRLIEDKQWLAASTLVGAARRPCIVAGLGIIGSGAHSHLQRLAESWGAPVMVTPKAVGHFPGNHPLYAGCVTAYGDGPLRQELDRADLIVAVGLDGVDLVSNTWDYEAPVISLAPSGSDDPVVRPEYAIDGPMPDLLDALVPLRKRDPTGRQRAATVRGSIQEALQTPEKHQNGAIKVDLLISALRDALPLNGAVTLDVGVFKLLFLQHWRTDAPNSLFVSNGLAAMGYAVPGAMAIRMARPDRPVVAIVGDGALLMYAGELASVARLGKPLVILLIVDEALALIRLKQLRSAVPIHGTELESTDFGSLARAFGLGYLLVDDGSSARENLRRAFAAGRPILVEARIDRGEYDHFI